MGHNLKHDIKYKLYIFYVIFTKKFACLKICMKFDKILKAKQ